MEKAEEEACPDGNDVRRNFSVEGMLTARQVKSVMYCPVTQVLRDMLGLQPETKLGCSLPMLYLPISVTAGKRKHDFGILCWRIEMVRETSKQIIAIVPWYMIPMQALKINQLKVDLQYVASAPNIPVHRNPHTAAIQGSILQQQNLRCSSRGIRCLLKAAL